MCTTKARRPSVETNHIVALDERNDIPGFYENGEPVEGMPFQTVERKKAAKRFLKKHADDLEVKDFKRMLTRAPINMANADFMTLQSAIVACDGDKCRMYCSAGHDPSREWNKYGF